MAAGIATLEKAIRRQMAEGRQTMEEGSQASALGRSRRPRGARTLEEDLLAGASTAPSRRWSNASRGHDAGQGGGGGKDTVSVVAALGRQMRTLPTALRHSLTWDRGLELAQHAASTVATDGQVYFCDPQSPWQRGTNENTNRLLRPYLPTGAHVAAHSQAELNRIAHRLNARPRKTLAYRTPADVFAAAVAMTG